MQAVGKAAKPGKRGSVSDQRQWLLTVVGLPNMERLACALQLLELCILQHSGKCSSALRSDVVAQEAAYTCQHP